MTPARCKATISRENKAEYFHMFYDREQDSEKEDGDFMKTECSSMDLSGIWRFEMAAKEDAGNSAKQ